MIEFLKVEGARLHSDGPTPRTITNQGPDKLYVGDANVTTDKYDQVVDVDDSVELDAEHFLVSAGRSRIVVERDTPEGIRIQRLEERLSALEGSGSKSRTPSRRSPSKSSGKSKSKK